MSTEISLFIQSRFVLHKIGRDMSLKCGAFIIIIG